MNARMRAGLYAAGFTSPEMVLHAISHATASAANAPRLTRSRRVNKSLRRIVWLLLVLAVFAAVRLA